MKTCPECNGVRNIFIGEGSLDIRLIDCPTCEGDGEIPDEPADNHCPACGEPIAVDASWCQFHRAAAELE